MCGIYGWSLPVSSRIEKNRKAVMAGVLAITNDTRGGDSWGFYDLRTLVHGLGDISNAAIQTIDKHLLMAHTRKATTGSISCQNAHPFEIGNVIGAHNGIITNHTELNTKYKREFAVDSMHIFGHLNDGLPLTDVYGYGAIHFARKEAAHKGRIYLCKISGGGDLSLFGIGKGPKNYNGVVWSSNDSHAKTALKAAGLPHFELELKANQLYFVENGQAFIATGETLALGERNYGGSMPDWRNGYSSGYDYRSGKTYKNGAYVDDDDEPSKSDTSTEGMSERRFREAWEKELELEMVDSEEEKDTEDWEDEQKQMAEVSVASKDPHPTAPNAPLKYTAETTTTVSDQGDMDWKSGWVLNKKTQQWERIGEKDSK